MNIWLITVGEPLPTEADDRPYRTGMLSQVLQSAGHRVVWWSSTFDHVRKRHRFDETTRTDLPDGRRLILLHGSGYKKNVSLRRILDQRKVSKQFTAVSAQEAEPDLILCSYPTMELCKEAIRYAEEHSIPIVIDVRDLWPDIFVRVVPTLLQPLLRLLLTRWFAVSVSVFKSCTAITGVSAGYVSWGIERGGREYEGQHRCFPLAYSVPSYSKRVISGAKTQLASIGLNEDKHIVVFSGSFGRTYDLSVPIRAAEILSSQGVDEIQFVFCGDGEMRDYWKNLAKDLHNVLFTGWLDQRSLSYILTAASIGLAAYAKGAPQGIPNKVIEYMAAGLPILSSLEGETEKLLTETYTGWTYGHSDENGLVQALRSMLESDDRATMSRNCLTVFESRFDASVVYQQFITYLEEIVDT